MDFNPTVDRLRIISDDGQNLRVNVEDGITLVDGTLAYTPGTPAPGIAGAAYTNNDTEPIPRRPSMTWMPPPRLASASTGAGRLMKIKN